MSDWKNKIVLIGTTSPTVDAHATSFINQSLDRLLVSEWTRKNLRELMPGVEVHANVIATMVDRSFITTPWWLATPFLLAVGGMGLGIAQYYD